MELFTKLFNKDEKISELENEIKSLQVRKASILSVFQKEIREIQNEQNNILLLAGTRAYEGWKNQDLKVESLEEFWKQMKEKEDLLKEKEIKMAEMEAKYDEEIFLLQKGLNTESIVGGKDGQSCPQCGAAVNRADIFCQKCGTKLK